MMRKLLFVLVAALALAGCQALEKAKTVEDVKKDLVCVDYKPGMEWTEISRAFGEPDVAPAPPPGTESGANARVYRNMVVIFHTERKPLKVGDKTRYVEVVTDVEFGRKK